MTVEELADFIRKNKQGLNYPGGWHSSEDVTTVLQYTRHEMRDLVYITDEHIFECCEKASSYQEHIELCKPLAKSDTDKFNEARRMPPGKGRTRRRFR